MSRDDFHTVACKTTVCTVWKDTKHVSFLSNIHSSHGNCTISRKLRRGENAILPCRPCAVDYNKNMGAVDRHDQLVRNYAIDRKSRRWWVRMFVNFLGAIMVNAYIIYKENFKNMNMPAPEKPPKATWTWQVYVWNHPQLDWKFFLPSSAWPTSSTASHLFSWKRARFCQSRWVGASQVWKMPSLLHQCKRSKAQRNSIWLQNLC